MLGAREKRPRTDEEKARIDEIVAEFKGSRDKEKEKAMRFKQQGEALQKAIDERSGTEDEAKAHSRMIDGLNYLQAEREAREAAEAYQRNIEKVRAKAQGNNG